MPSAFTRIVTKTKCTPNDVNQVIKAWEGDTALGVPLNNVEVDSSTKYAGDFKNLDATNALAFRARNASGETLIDAKKNSVTLGKDVTLSSGVFISNTPKITKRQGGDANNWGGYSGVTDYDVAASAHVMMQVGYVDIDVVSGETTKALTITFPVAFTHYPLVFATPSYSGRDASFWVKPVPGEAGFELNLACPDPGAPGFTYTFTWMAIGV